jgi:Asp/Glu/hydantoin racemase
VRIYHQSFLDPDQHPAYFARLRAHLAQVADPGTEFEVGGVSPPDAALSRLSEFRCAVSAVANIIDAEERGFDAAVIGHFQDSGLYEARCAVDIPVLGLGEASMLYAGQLGRGFGLVTIDDVFVSWHAEQAEVYGLRERLAGVTSMHTPPAELVAAFDDDAAAGAVHDAFVAAARPLVARGAEVVISAGGLFALLSAGRPAFDVDGAVVLDPLSLTAKLAEVAVKLGHRPSRAGTFARAPRQAVEEFRTLARGGAHA